MPGGGGTQSRQPCFQKCPSRRTYHRPRRRRSGRQRRARRERRVVRSQQVYLSWARRTAPITGSSSRAKKPGLKSIDALRSATGISIGAQTVGHSNYFVGRLFALLIGFKDPKMVVGYSGNELDVALMRGEIDGRINNPDTLTIRNAEWLAKGMIDIHAIMEVPRGLKQPGFDRLPEDRRVRQIGAGKKVTGDGSHLPPNRHAVFLSSWHAGGTGKNSSRRHGENVQRSGLSQRI